MIIKFKQFAKFKIIAILVAIIFIIFCLYLIYVPVQAGDTGPIEVNIKKGQSLSEVAESLKGADVVWSESLFVIYVRMRGEAGQLKAGRYIFSKSLNLPMIVALLVDGRAESDDLEVTITEGLNIWEIDKRLTGLGLIPEGHFSSRYYNDEGYLFPDTYRLKNKKQNTNSKAQEIIKVLRDKMKDNFKNKTAELLKNLDDDIQKRAIIVASILEKEAKTEEDMRLVAGIIEKRLSLGIPLQVDATVIYGACLRNFQFPISNFQNIKNCDVTFQSPAIEIKIDGPFNTYIRKDLPPAPISNPGLKAIQAALNPEKSDYFYYLSTRDGGQMIYSKTLGEHATNRKKYLGI